MYVVPYQGLAVTDDHKKIKNYFLFEQRFPILTMTYPELFLLLLQNIFPSYRIFRFKASLFFVEVCHSDKK